MWNFLGGLVGGAGSLLGGIFGANNQSNIAAQNIAYQNLYAKNRIQWTVADAQKAGINPLAALGNATQTYSNQVGDNSLGAGISGAGQSLGRAIDAIASTEDRTKELENKLLEAKIANVNADTVHSAAVTSGMVRGLGVTGSPPPVPLPKPNPLTVNWDAYNAKPLMEKYVGPHGGLVDLPTGNASTAMQNWASMPAQIAVAAGLTGENALNAASDLGPWTGIRGDVWRGVDNSQWVPF